MNMIGKNMIGKVVGFGCSVLAAGALEASVTFSDNTGAVEPVEGVVTLGEGGKITYSGDSTLDPVVNATADLTIESDEVCERVYDGGDIFPTSSMTPMTIFENMDLTEWEPTYTYFDYNDHPQVTNIEGDGHAHYIKRGADKNGNAYLTAQMHNAGGGGLVRIKLAQSGANVVAQATEARYAGSITGTSIWPDYDNPLEKGNGWTVATTSSTGYNVNYLVMRRVAKPAKLTITNAVTYATSLKIANNAYVVAQGENAIASGSATLLSGANTVDGFLEINGRGVTTLGGTFSGTDGSVLIEPRKDMAERETEIVTDEDLGSEYETLTTTWWVLKENAQLINVTAIDVESLVCYSTKVTAKTYCFKNDGVTASAWAEEVCKGNCRAVRIALRQNGDNIEIRSDAAAYNAPTGYDYDADPEGKKKGWSVGSYNVVGWSVTFGTPTRERVVLNCDNMALKFGLLDVIGSEDHMTYVAVNNRGFPMEYGDTRFGPNETVTYASTLSYDSSLSYGYRIYVWGQSIIQTSEAHHFDRGAGHRVVLDDSQSQVGGSWGYRNQMTFHNGSVMRMGSKAASCSLGWTAGATWIVSGTGVSTYEKQAGIIFVGGSTSDGYPWKLYVNDTTGDEAADFIINDDISLNSGYKYHHAYKQGAGTVLLNGKYTSNTYPLHLQGGVWKAGITGSFTNSAVKVDLNGGNLAFAANTTNWPSALILQQDAALAVEEGAVVEFAATTNETWVAGKTLTVTMGEGAKLRFGTSADSITADQLAQIKFVEAGRQKLRTAVIDADGYVTAKPRKGLCIMFR